MTDGDALLRAVCEHPEDDTPRLVYADRLEENGRPERAEFIRLQCERWNLYPTLGDARRRAQALERQFGDAWYDELPSPAGVLGGGLFVRGFIDSVQIAADDGRTFQRLETVLRAAPVARLTVEPLNQSRLRRLLALSVMERLTHLRVPWFAPGSTAPYPYTDASRACLAATAERFPQLKLNYPPGEHRR